jgi:probable phosphoglycerate mutase
MMPDKHMALKIYFLRHGETTASQARGYCGALDPDMTPDGYRMAEDFAEFYKSLTWTAVFSSPMRRTIATAKPLCDIAKLQMQLKDGFKELAYGKWEGKSSEQASSEFHDDYIRWLTDPGWNAPTGGERGIDVARRASQALEEIIAERPSGNILVVSHKATIRIMLCSLLGIDVGRYRERIAMAVSAVSILEIESHGPLLHTIGDRSHLRASLLSLPAK